MRTVTENAYKQYVRSRPAASSDSNRRIKELPFLTCGIHPIFRENEEYVEEERENLLDKMKNYRPQGVSTTGFSRIEERIQSWPWFEFNIWKE